MKRLAWLSTFLATILAVPASAQVAVQPGTIVGTFAASAYAPSNIIYTVPGDRNARITDVLVTNYHTANCGASIYVSSGYYLYFYVPARSTLPIPLNTGIGMTPGMTVQVATTDCPGNIYMYVQIRGFNFTIP